MKEVAENMLRSSSPLSMAQRAVDVIAALRSPVGLEYRKAIGNADKALRRYGEKNAITGENFDDVKDVTRKLYKAVTTSDTKEAVTLLNDMLATFAPSPRLNWLGDNSWRLQFDGDDRTPWIERFAASSALAFAALLAEKGHNPCGVCASPSCARLFIDLGKGSSQKYCSPRCATRERVAAYRKGTV